MRTIAGKMREAQAVHKTVHTVVLVATAMRKGTVGVPANTRNVITTHSPGAVNLTVTPVGASMREVNTGADSNAVTKVSADAVMVPAKTAVGGTELQMKLLRGSETERLNVDDKWIGSASSVDVGPKVIADQMNALRKT